MIRLLYTEMMHNPWNANSIIDELDIAGQEYNSHRRRGIVQNILRKVADHNRYLIRNEEIPVTKKYSAFSDLTIVPMDGNIVLENLTTDEAIVKYQNYNTVALNYANGNHAGGGYLHGATAQEEELCRQYPLLFASLYKYHLYPLTLGEILVTQNVKRMREMRQLGYDVIINPTVKTTYISAAAPNLRDKSINQFPLLRAGIDRTVEMIFRTPKNIDSTYDVLIVGAWGCGAFAPYDGKFGQYARLMAESFALMANQYRKLYKYIVFAIPKSFEGNYDAFQSVLTEKGMI